MNTATLSEFRLLTGFSAEELLLLLEEGELKTICTANGALVIDLQQLDIARFPGVTLNFPPRIPLALRPLVEEVIATELLRFLDRALPEALELALQWNNSRTSSEQSVDVQNGE